MSAGDEDDSRPSGPFISQRPTARDVPIAKYKEPSSAPRGLRGASLLPGQGAPERIVPEDIELAVLREADTLDGQHIARAAASREPELNSSPAPTPVSVEVPRVRSVPPNLESYGTTPTTPSARSVQSGTLMSIGSVDPRAPTELSLPSPRVLSQSERAAYLGPEAIVDRTPVSALPSSGSGVVNVAQRAELAERQGPYSEPMAHSSARGLPAASQPPASSARRSQRADSPAPHARQFGRPPRSYSPVSHTPAPHSPARESEPPSVPDIPPQFQIHSQLDALPHELGDDTFDLRSVSTQREPLAGRKPMDSTDWTRVHEPVSPLRDSSVPSERSPSGNPSSSSAITILVDSGRISVAPARESIPSALPVVSRQTAVPLSWVLGAGAFALLLALLVAWVMRVPSAPESAHAVDARARAGQSTALEASQSSLQAALPAPRVPPASAEDRPLPTAASLSALGVPPKTAASSSARSLEIASSGPSARPAPLASVHPSDAHATAPSGTEAGSKPHRSIY
jgi:hypothetical protein